MGHNRLCGEAARAWFRRAAAACLAAAGLAVVLFVVLGCATTADRAPRLDRPVLSWPGDPATRVAVSWFPGARDLTLVGPDGTTTRHPAEVSGGVARVILTGLEPATGYRYSLGSGGASYRFRTFDDPRAAGRPMRFAVLGDLQPFNAETDRTVSLVLEKVASLDPEFAIQVGDVSEVGISAASWKRAIGLLSILGAEAPILAAAGNHDYYYGLPSARTFKTLFPYPYAGRESLRHDTWYSLGIGPVHLAVLDTEASGAVFDAQLAWLEADLAAARARGVEWVLITMHWPILATATGADRQEWAIALFPLIARYGVDAVFWGHDHLFEHYEYRYGANGYVLNPGDPVADRPVHLFTVGTSGARVDALYRGFFDRRPFPEPRTLYAVGSGEPSERVFEQRPWRREMVRLEGEGVRYQNTSVYPDAGSYIHYPFDTAADFEARRYSTDPERRYSDDAEFFGYTYGESSIHYLWIEVDGDRMTISAHYADGRPGEQGTLITTPHGSPMRWEIERAR